MQIEYPVDEREAGRIVGWSVPQMRADRFGRRRVPFLKIGKSVRYLPSKLIEFRDAHAQGGVSR